MSEPRSPDGDRTGGGAADCCARTPIAPTPPPPANAADPRETKPRETVDRPGTGCCGVAAKDCVDCELTDYAREHVANTGRLIQSCACIKFNGLQDSCRHPGCIGTTRTGCMDNPFPSCSPARKWKCDFICKNNTKPDGC